MDFNFKHFENNLGQIYCSLRYHDQLKAITVTWKGTAQLGGLEKVKNEVVKMIKRKHALFLINDFQDLYYNASDALAKFLEESWDDEVHAAGLQYVIHVWKEGTEVPPVSAKAAKYIRFSPSKLDAVEWIQNQLKEIS
ncbi:hypothetical protein I5M27_18155 [Adhaeribacter sp. BT258]|uniref:STAS/SEC14 domain-containing protein n=1 Tax=Adhaeribacter terrigena TaxID=2793070 RepID=A0ABS1C6C5_9BACT|nr:hypothetical protein [Adhaeribacter terrigena]MBK0404920.1 hypothetical protein [Adhaeribacter terrigena]